jgi:hypothetical protein
VIAPHPVRWTEVTGGIRTAGVWGEVDMPKAIAARAIEFGWALAADSESVIPSIAIRCSSLAR